MATTPMQELLEPYLANMPYLSNGAPVFRNTINCGLEDVATASSFLKGLEQKGYRNIVAWQVAGAGSSELHVIADNPCK